MTRLRSPCEHDLYDEHEWNWDGHTICPGGEFATLDDLVAAINGMGVEGTVRISYIGPDQPPVYLEEAEVKTVTVLDPEHLTTLTTFWLAEVSDAALQEEWIRRTTKGRMEQTMETIADHFAAVDDDPYRHWGEDV